MLEFHSPEAAANVLKSVEMDNDEYVDSRLDGSSIVAHMEADSLRSLLHTLDDFLSCVGVAEKVISKNS